MILILSIKIVDMHQFEKLKIRQKAMDLTEKIYMLCIEPSNEKYNLILQLKKSATSIPSSISEGSRKYSDLEFLHFLSIANGSAYELINQLNIFERVGIAKGENTKPCINELVEISNMNFSLQKSIREKLKKISNLNT